MSEPIDAFTEDPAPVDDLTDPEETAFEDELGGDPDGSQLPVAARRALTTLLTNRFITRSSNRAAWEALLVHEHEIRERLADMFLFLVVDRDYEVAFKRQDPAEDAPKILRRDKPLSRDASLLLIHLRKEHTYTDATDDPVVITRVHASEFLRPFREEGDADDAKFEDRVKSAIRALRELHLLTPNPDADYLFTVSPAVVPLIGADEMLRFEQYFTKAAEEAGTDEDLGNSVDAEEDQP